MNYLKPLALLLMFFISCPASAQPAVSFPLRLSDNKRYLIDSHNSPFLIKEFSAWGWVQTLSEPDASAFLDSIQLKGFNTILTCIVNNHIQMTGNPPNWQGIPPFTVKWDFSKPDPGYFEHVDRILKIAEQKGFFVMALPFYAGYTEDPTQGWWDEILDIHNDTLKMKKYGEFLGNRYKNTKNMMWVAGGDNNMEGKFFAYENNTIRGIRSVSAAQLWSGHFDMNRKVIWSSDHPLLGNEMDIDGLYVWTESVLMERGPQYKTELEHYARGKMIIQLDQSYEHDAPHYADNENYQWIRRKMYDGLLSGCKGTSFSAGEIDNQCYTFAKWRPLMNTTGMMQVSYCFRLFESRAWEKLVPDQTSDIILSGRGIFGEQDYICAAKASDNSSYIMYIPRGHTFYMNMKKMTGRPMAMYWYNPRTGTGLKIGVAETREKFGVTPPSEEDWVLVFDDDSLKLPAPGI